jgi:hypothetical protein
MFILPLLRIGVSNKINIFSFVWIKPSRKNLQNWKVSNIANLHAYSQLWQWLKYYHYYQHLIQNVTEWAGIVVILLDTYIFRRYSVQILAETPTISTEVFHGFPQSLVAYPGVVPWLVHDDFLPNPNFITILLFNTM